MQIISKFKDVYDSMAVYGIDKGVTYQRNFSVERKIVSESIIAEFKQKLWNLHSLSNIFVEGNPRFQGSSIHNAPGFRFTLKPCWFMVGEQIIPVLIDFSTRHHNRIESGQGGLISQGFYPFKSSGEAIGVNDLFNQAPSGYTSIESAFRYCGESQNYDLSGVKFGFRRLLLEETSPDEVIMPFTDKNLATRLSCPLALITTHYDYCPKRRKRRMEVTIIRNPSVKNLNLAGCMEPFKIHQEITMALSGFLARQDDAAMNISDIDMASAKGFGEESFKTRKGSKKPRRRKKGCA